MSEHLILLYWDACIFYEHLNDEQQNLRKKEAIDKFLEENKARRNRICTSVLTHTEVIPKKLTKVEEEKYWNKFQSIYFFDIEIDRSIIALSREIKNYYYIPSDPKTGQYRMMSTGDAIHLATAVIHTVDEIHTRDKNSKGGNIKLLGLVESSANGKLCGIYPLRIISPELAQASLPLLEPLNAPKIPEPPQEASSPSAGGSQSGAVGEVPPDGSGTGVRRDPGSLREGVPEDRPAEGAKG
jgi:predicted nucleic acid-binding protein